MSDLAKARNAPSSVLKDGVCRYWCNVGCDVCHPHCDDPDSFHWSFDTVYYVVVMFLLRMRARFSRVYALFHVLLVSVFSVLHDVVVAVRLRFSPSGEGR